MSGQAIRRDENDYTAATIGDPHEIYYRFGGKQLGYVGNNGTLDTSYAQSIAGRTVTGGTGAFRNGSATSVAYADFDQSVAPINSYYQGASGGGYTVRAGDTLAGIAANLYGDASRRCRGLLRLNSIRWIEFSPAATGCEGYKIAEANGMGAGAALPPSHCVLRRAKHRRPIPDPPRRRHQGRGFF